VRLNAVSEPPAVGRRHALGRDGASGAHRPGGAAMLRSPEPEPTMETRRGRPRDAPGRDRAADAGRPSEAMARVRSSRQQDRRSRPAQRARLRSRDRRRAAGRGGDAASAATRDRSAIQARRPARSARPRSPDRRRAAARGGEAPGSNRARCSRPAPRARPRSRGRRRAAGRGGETASAWTPSASASQRGAGRPDALGPRLRGRRPPAGRAAMLRDAAPGPPASRAKAAGRCARPTIARGAPVGRAGRRYYDRVHPNPRRCGKAHLRCPNSPAGPASATPPANRVGRRPDGRGWATLAIGASRALGEPDGGAQGLGQWATLRTPRREFAGEPGKPAGTKRPATTAAGGAWRSPGGELLTSGWRRAPPRSRRRRLRSAKRPAACHLAQFRARPTCATSSP
jgi:hypothetical protein